MSSVQSLPHHQSSWLADLHHRGRETHLLWYYSAIGYLALTAVFFVAQFMDARLFYGVSVWAKPFKFALSIGVYFATLAVFAAYMPANYFSTLRGKVLTGIPVIAGLFEMAYIAYQASLGEASHFNYSSAFHANMYTLMGIGATLMVAIFVWMGVSIARANSMQDPLILAIVIGLFLTFLLGGGFGGYLGSASSHWVGGAATDANGSEFFNWARDGGDLRVAHFFGMHAMQALPLFALILPKTLPNAMRLALVVGFAAAYTGFSYATFAQAIQGQPFLG